MFVVLTVSIWTLRFASTVLSVCVCVGSLFGFVPFTSFVCFSGSHLVWYCDLLGNPIPDGINTVPIVQSLKDTIATYHDEIKVVLNFEALNVWIADNNIWISTIARSFGFDVSECFGNRESSWEYSQGSLHIEVFLTWAGCCFSKSLGSVNLSSRCLDSYLFKFVVRLMISWEDSDLCSCINGHHSSWVSNIDDVYHVINDHDNICTGPRSLRSDILASHQVLSPSLCLLYKAKEVSFAFMKSFLDSLYWILWKLLILHNEIV